MYGVLPPGLTVKVPANRVGTASILCRCLATRASPASPDALGSPSKPCPARVPVPLSHTARHPQPPEILPGRTDETIASLSPASSDGMTAAGKDGNAVYLASGDAWRAEDPANERHGLVLVGHVPHGSFIRWDQGCAQADRYVGVLHEFQEGRHPGSMDGPWMALSG